MSVEKVESARVIGFSVRGLSYFACSGMNGRSVRSILVQVPFGLVVPASHYMGFSVLVLSCRLLSTSSSDFPTLASAMSKFPASATARLSEVTTIFGVVIMFLAHLAIHAWWYANGKRNGEIRLRLASVSYE
jgi:hypothetical protein